MEDDFYLERRRKREHEDVLALTDAIMLHGRDKNLQRQQVNGLSRREAVRQLNKHFPKAIWDKPMTKEEQLAKAIQDAKEILSSQHTRPPIIWENPN